MQQSFNPYQQWLGIPGTGPTNFYELLGLRLFENNVQTIAQAIDARTARVRGVRPGLHVKDWRKVLDQLNSAKTTLLDVTAKAKYDATLRGGGPQSITARKNEPSPAAADPQRATSAAAPRASTGNVPPSPIPFAMPASQTSQSAWGSVPTAVPLASSGEMGSASVGEPAAAAIPVQSGSEDGPSGPFETPIGQFPAPRSEPRRPARRRSMAIGVPVVLVALVAVAATLAHQVYQKRQETSARAQVSQGGPAGARQRRSVDTAESRSGINDIGQKTPSLAQRTAGSDPSRRSRSGGAADRSESASGVTAKPPGSQKATIGRGPAGSTAVGTPQESPAFRAAVKKVLSAMSVHDMERARRELQSAGEFAKTEAEKAETGRLDAMIGYLDEFWKGMSRVVAGLEGGEVFTFNDEPIVVVEGTSETLILRGRGQNREYAIRSIPALMVMRLAETYFHGAESRALYGVFLAVDPKGDPQRARQLWETAARAGVDVQLLLEMDPAQFGDSGKAESDTGGSAKGEPLERKIAVLEEAERAARGLQDQKEIAEEALALWEQAMKASRPEEAKRVAEIAFSAAQKSKSAALMKAAKSAGEQVERMGHQE